MKSSIIVSLSLATLALAAPLPQIGASFITTGVVEASTVTPDVATSTGVIAAQDNAPQATDTGIASIASLATVTSNATDVLNATATAALVTDTAALAQATAAVVLNSTDVAGVVNNSTLNTTLTPNVSSQAALPPTTGAVNIDTTVLNLAFVLEQLESQFYTAGLQAFGLQQMTAAGLSDTQARIIIETIQNVQSDEATHATTLSTVIASLGATPFTGCSFNLQPALADPITFMAIARTLEAVGVSAYLGAAHLLTDPALLTAAGSILTLEARHQSILNTFNGGSFAPQAFDIALSPQQVLALAGGFLENCNAGQLGLTSNQPLSITDSSSRSTRFRIGSQLSFASSVTLDLNNLSCQMLVGGAPVALVFNSGSCIVPPGIDGAVAIYLTSSSTPLQSNLITQDASIIVAGPGLIFVDSSSSSLSSMFSISSNHGSSASADFGGMYMSGQNNRNSFWNHGSSESENSHRSDSNVEVVVVKQQVEVVTQVVNEIIINNDRNTFDSGRSDRSNTNSHDSNSRESNTNSHDNSKSRDNSNSHDGSRNSNSRNSNSNSNSHDNSHNSDNSRNSNSRDSNSHESNSRDSRDSRDSRSYRYNYKESHRNYGGTREMGWQRMVRGSY